LQQDNDAAEREVKTSKVKLKMLEEKVVGLEEKEKMSSASETKAAEAQVAEAKRCAAADKKKQNQEIAKAATARKKQQEQERLKEEKNTNDVLLKIQECDKGVAVIANWLEESKVMYKQVHKATVQRGKELEQEHKTKVDTLCKDKRNSAAAVDKVRKQLKEAEANYETIFEEKVPLPFLLCLLAACLLPLRLILLIPSFLVVCNAAPVYPREGTSGGEQEICGKGTGRSQGKARGAEPSFWS